MDEFYSEEQRSLMSMVRRFGEDVILPRAADIDRSDRFDRDIYRQLAELGLFGVCLPEDAGGTALGTTAACIVLSRWLRRGGRPR